MFPESCLGGQLGLEVFVWPDMCAARACGGVLGPTLKQWSNGASDAHAQIKEMLSLVNLLSALWK